LRLKAFRACFLTPNLKAFNRKGRKVRKEISAGCRILILERSRIQIDQLTAAQTS